MDNFNKIIDFFVHLTSKKLLSIVIFIISFIIIFPFIDNNFLYFSRMENRIDILDKVSKLDTELINENKVLSEEYKSIMGEINHFDNKYILSNNNLFNQRTVARVRNLKIISGASIFILLFLLTFFRSFDFAKKVKYSIILLLMTVSGAIFGGIMPTFRIHMVNYLGVPILEVIGIYSTYKIFTIKENL